MRKLVPLSVLLWIACGVCATYAVVRYRDYRNTVGGRFDNTLQKLGVKDEPHVPDTVKWSALGAVVCAMAAGGCLIVGRK